MTAGHSSIASVHAESQGGAMKPAVLLGACFLFLPVGTSAQNKEAPVYRPGDGVSTPVLVSDRKPVFPSEAAGLEGLVKLECCG